MRVSFCVRVLIALTFAGCASAPSRAPDHNVLYRISSPSKAEPVAWLLSSPAVEFAAPEVDAEVALAFAASSSLALEVDLGATPLLELVEVDRRNGLYSDGSLLVEHIGEDDLARVQSWLDVLGAETTDLSHSRAATVFLLLMQAFGVNADELEKASGSLYFVAVSRGTRPVHALMTFDEHQAAMNTVDVEVEVDLLRGTLSELERSYSPGAEHVDLLFSACSKEGSCPQTALQQKFDEYSALVNATRYGVLASRLDALLETGERPFVVIDEPHFEGEHSLPAQLRRLGYTVERVPLADELVVLEPPPEWAMLPTSKVTKYTVDWPVEPEWQTVSDQGYSQAMRVATTRDGSYVVMEQPVPVAILPIPSSPGSRIDALFDAQLATPDQETGSPVVNSSVVEIASFPGRRYRLSQVGGEQSGFLVWADSVQYAVVAVVPSGASPEAVAKQEGFLDSFQLQTYSPEDAKRSRELALERLEDEPEWLFPYESCPLEQTRQAKTLTDSDENPCSPDVDACLDACREGDALSCLGAAEALKGAGASPDGYSALAVRACGLGLVEGCSGQASGLLFESDSERQACGADLAEVACAAGEPWGCLLHGVALAQGIRGTKAQPAATVRAPLAKVCRLASQREVCKIARLFLLTLEATSGAAERVADAANPLRTSKQLEATATCAVSCAPNVPCLNGVCGDVVQLVAGMGPTCALLASGSVLCWGNIGDGEAHESPVPVPNLTDAVELAAGGRQVCARRADETVVCWGDQHFGEFGGSKLTPQTPVPVAGLDDAVQVVVGSRHACVLHRDTGVSCWGDNGFGQLGMVGTQERYATPQRLAWLSDVVELSTSGSHTCARVSTGEVVCWGWNASGQLGDGTFTDRREPVQVFGLEDAVQIEAGDMHTCARKGDGSVVCWGNRSRPRGDAKETPGSVLVPIGLGAQATDLSTGFSNACALLADGSAACWGRVSSGSEGSSATALPVEGLNDIVEIVAGFKRTYARVADGRVFYWGEQVESKERSMLPVQVKELDSATELYSGANWTCARQAAGETLCWGENYFGGPEAVGNENRFVPVPFPMFDPFTEVAAGYWHACARDPSNAVVCWGPENQSGIVRLDKTAPTPIPDLGEVVELSSGGYSSCARLSSGHVKCWGANYYGQLGDGSTEPRTGPVEVVGLDDAVRLAAGESHVCAVRSKGTVECWGQNSAGQLGIGSFEPTASPTPVAGINDAVDIVASWGHTCALRARGEVSCWGDGTDGQLGNGGWEVESSPTAAFVTDAVQLVAGTRHTCARLRSGDVVCWGSNSDGQLGDGIQALRQKPVRVTGIDNAVELVSGFDHTCARLASGEVRCWGADYSGQLGNGDSDEKPTPVEVLGLASRRCGDGVLLAEERCDDGNEVAGDGCSAACEVEPGSKCSGVPSWCRAPFDGEDCADPIRIELPAKVEGSFADRVNGLDPTWRSCTASFATGAEVVFAVMVPAGRLVDVKAASANADLILYATTECTKLARNCVAGSDQTATGKESIVLANLRGTEPLELFVVVDSYVQSEGTFEVEFGAPRVLKVAMGSATKAKPAMDRTWEAPIGLIVQAASYEGGDEKADSDEPVGVRVCAGRL
ncbi:MAG: hypothetical protein CO108_06560 [Deltaproteobacteria bacterium CG_4_9_14_3_um_filter_63_12]|nr:MAG: hypothetical protein CO108_06560 [Deltaproteobacteria bacterium CG_4_9_14_3_um_filter_63_12]